MATRFNDNQIADPRIRQFASDCRAAGSTPEDVLRHAGMHRTVWFRWRSGQFSPTLKTWDRAQAALTSIRRQKAESSDRRDEAAA